MRKMIVSGLIAAAAFGFSASQASAYDSGYGSGYRHTQYGGGGGGWGGGHARKECHWERKRVRVWNDYQRAHVWVWQRVQVCH